LQTQIALELINPTDMRMHEVALDGTCGQAGSEIHVKEPKTVHKFLLLISYPYIAVAYHRSTTPSPDGVV